MTDYNKVYVVIAQERAKECSSQQPISNQRPLARIVIPRKKRKKHQPGLPKGRNKEVKKIILL